MGLALLFPKLLDSFTEPSSEGGVRTVEVCSRRANSGTRARVRIPV